MPAPCSHPSGLSCGAKAPTEEATNDSMRRSRLQARKLVKPPRPESRQEIVRPENWSSRRGAATGNCPDRARPSNTHARRVAGGGRKPLQAKGTGRARQGSTAQPCPPHGGGVIVSGPNLVLAVARNRKERRLRPAYGPDQPALTSSWQGFRRRPGSPNREIRAACNARYCRRAKFGSESCDGPPEAVRLSVRNCSKR